ncbi:MAG TPA: hypothetical protein VLG47_04195 [Candidatus Saccharimonadales bacterium]|nr:hypothetical protein [Candidatus Saccharimonadales bacterium]
MGLNSGHAEGCPGENCQWQFARERSEASCVCRRELPGLQEVVKSLLVRPSAGQPGWPSITDYALILTMKLSKQFGFYSYTVSLILIILGALINSQDTGCPPIYGGYVTTLIFLSVGFFGLGTYSFLSVRRTRLLWTNKLWARILLTILFIVIYGLVAIFIGLITIPGGLFNCWKF